MIALIGALLSVITTGGVLAIGYLHNRRLDGGAVLLEKERGARRAEKEEFVAKIQSLDSELRSASTLRDRFALENERLSERVSAAEGGLEWHEEQRKIHGR